MSDKNADKALLDGDLGMLSKGLTDFIDQRAESARTTSIGAAEHELVTDIGGDETLIDDIVGVELTELGLYNITLKNKIDSHSTRNKLILVGGATILAAGFAIRLRYKKTKKPNIKLKIGLL